MTNRLDDVRHGFFSCFFPHILHDSALEFALRLRHASETLDSQWKVLTRAAWPANQYGVAKFCGVACLVTPEHPSSESGSQRSKTDPLQFLERVERVVAALYIVLQKVTLRTSLRTGFVGHMDPCFFNLLILTRKTIE